MCVNVVCLLALSVCKNCLIVSVVSRFVRNFWFPVLYFSLKVLFDIIMFNICGSLILSLIDLLLPSKLEIFNFYTKHSPHVFSHIKSKYLNLQVLNYFLLFSPLVKTWFLKIFFLPFFKNLLYVFLKEFRSWL